jgi:glycerol-3-phosphate cytidylyltransferase
MKKVITYGTFDLFHEGHQKLLERSKALGDYLIVGVTTEQFDISRGKMNVVDSLMRRIDNVRNCGFVDEVIIEEREGQKIEDIQKLGVDIFTIGSDWRGKFDYIKKYCEVVYLDRTQNVSSSGLRQARHGLIKLGIVGTGRIAGRTMDELRYVSGVFPAAVYNPHILSAKKFSETKEVPFPTDNYEEFLENVDAVYIASPHETHYDYIRRALNANRHVLCEKPMVLCETEAKELFTLANESGLVLMEAIKTAYAPGFVNLAAIARSGRIGRIYDVEAAFTKLVPYGENVREYDSVVGGSFTELASYSLLPVIKLLGADYKKVDFDFFKAENGVDIYTKARLTYDNAVAAAKTGIGVKSEGQLLVSGTEGYILVKSPWWLLKSFEVCYENPENNDTFSVPFQGYGMRFEIADFIRNINEPAQRNYKLLHEDSIAIASIIEAFLRERKK